MLFCNEVWKLASCRQVRRQRLDNIFRPGRCTKAIIRRSIFPAHGELPDSARTRSRGTRTGAAGRGGRLNGSPGGVVVREAVMGVPNIVAEGGGCRRRRAFSFLLSCDSCAVFCVLRRTFYNRSPRVSTPKRRPHGKSGRGREGPPTLNFENKLECCKNGV